MGWAPTLRISWEQTADAVARDLKGIMKAIAERLEGAQAPEPPRAPFSLVVDILEPKFKEGRSPRHMTPFFFCDPAQYQPSAGLQCPREALQERGQDRRLNVGQDTVEEPSST